MRIDWQTYYDAAKRCHDVADELARADQPLSDAVVFGECAGMAGDAPGCKEWGKTYDRSATDTIRASTILRDSLYNFGYVLYAAGYNYGIANKSDPAPDLPATHTTPQPQKIPVPTSVHDNGIGIDSAGGVEELFAKLLEEILQVFGKLPNGDVDKLDKASSAWKSFADNDAVKGAAGRISEIINLFDNTEDDNLESVLTHLSTLKAGAEGLALASAGIASPVADYHFAMVGVRTEIESAITSAEWAIGLTVVAAAAAAWFTFGGSVAAGAGSISVTVANTINTIRTTYQASRLIKVVGIAAAAAGAVGVIHAFDALPDLDSIHSTLAAIIALTVRIDGDTPDTPATNGPDVSSQIDVPGLDTEGEAHVRDGHYEGGKNVNDSKGIFLNQEDPYALADAAQSTPATGPSTTGRYERIVDAGHVIGNVSESQGGTSTTRYKVVQDKYGGVITMYPVP